MATLPSGLVRQAAIAAGVERAKKKIGPDAVDISYRLDTDSTGEPSIFFLTILADSATEEDHLLDVTERIGAILFEEIRPYDWGLHPYLNFGSEAEWRKSKVGDR